MSGSVSLCSPSPSIPSRAGGPPGRRWVGGMGGGSKWRGPAQPSSAHHSPRHPTRPHLTPYTRVVILPPLVTLVRWMEWDERCDERMMTTRAGSHVSLRLVSAIWCLNRLVPSHLRPLSTSLLVHRPPLVTLRLTSSTSLVSSGGRREDTTDGRRRETSGERKWHAWAKGRRKWVKGGHFLGPVPPAGTAKGRDGTEEWRDGVKVERNRGRPFARYASLSLGRFEPPSHPRRRRVALTSLAPVSDGNGNNMRE